MVRKKRHIWCFILGIGLANLLMGLAIYCGIAALASKLLTHVIATYPLQVYGAAAVGGATLLVAGLRLVLRTGQTNAETGTGSCEGADEMKAPAQLSPVSLFAMGAAFCMVELTSAFPYFGFLRSSQVRAATASVAGLSSYGVGRETRAARRFAHAERVAASMMPGKALAA